jgi:hypothetical protein
VATVPHASEDEAVLVDVLVAAHASSAR